MTTWLVMASDPSAPDLDVRRTSAVRDVAEFVRPGSEPQPLLSDPAYHARDAR
jgi:hypothetical protein